MMLNQMNNYCLGILLLSFTGLLSAVSQETGTPAQNAKILLEQIETKVSQRPGWDEPATAIESGVRGLRKIPEFVQLQEEANTAWPQIVGNIQTVAPSQMSKTILFVAFQSLPPDDYLQFLDKAVGLAEMKTVDKRLLKWALFPADKNVRGVLQYNYEKPVVKEIMQKVRVLYASDSNMVNLCDDLLSGKTKMGSEKYFNENPNDPRPGPALQKAANGGGKSPAASDLGSTATPVQKSTSALETKQSPSSFPIVPVAILALAIIGVIVVLLRRKHP